MTLTRVGRRDSRLFAVLGLVFTLSTAGALAIAWLSLDLLLNADARQHAVRWAESITKNIRDLDRILETGQVSAASLRILQTSVEVGQVFEYRIFDRTGRIRLSSEPSGIGKPPDHDTVERVLGSGQAFSRIEEKPDDSAMLRYSETYVPIIEDGIVKGALQIYIDHTANAAFFRKVLGFAVTGLVSVLLVAGLVSGSILLANTRARNRDEAALAESRARWRAIVEAEPEWVQLLCADGTVSETNPAGLAMVEADTPDQVIAKRAQHLVAPEHRRAFVALTDRVFQGQAGKLEFDIITLKGKRRAMDSHAVPLRDMAGNVTAYLSITRDVTERKRAERELRETKEAAVLASRAKSEFLANVSHELRTPLNAIIGFSEMLKTEALGTLGDDAYREYAVDINDSGNHLLGLINNILDLSKIEAGKYELHEEESDISDIVSGAIRIIRERAEAAGVELAVDIAGDPPRLYVDQRALKQVLLNLLSNALKFSARGSRITVRAGIDAGGRPTISVADTGIGIAEKDIPKALAPFEQIDNSLTRQQTGTGLGLPLAKRLIEQHGGILRLESEVGVGTTVTIHLPQERAVTAPNPVPAYG